MIIITHNNKFRISKRKIMSAMERQAQTCFITLAAEKVRDHLRIQIYFICEKYISTLLAITLPLRAM